MDKIGWRRGGESFATPSEVEWLGKRDYVGWAEVGKRSEFETSCVQKTD